VSLAPAAYAGRVFGFCLKPPFSRNGMRGFFSDGSAGKAAAVCAAFIATLAGADGSITLASEEKGAAAGDKVLKRWDDPDRGEACRHCSGFSDMITWRLRKSI